MPVGEKIKPEDRLRMLRARAQELQALMEENAGSRNPADRASIQQSEKPDAQSASDPPDNLLKPDHLGLFLRSLSSRLKSAIAEVRASSDDLDNLTDEVQRVEKLL